MVDKSGSGFQRYTAFDTGIPLKLVVYIQTLKFIGTDPYTGYQTFIPVCTVLIIIRLLYRDGTRRCFLRVPEEKMFSSTVTKYREIFIDRFINRIR